MILRVNKTLVLKQSTVYVTNKDLEYQRLTAKCERPTRILVTTDTITLIRGCLSLKKVYIPRIFLGLIHM